MARRYRRLDPYNHQRHARPGSPTLDQIRAFDLHYPSTAEPEAQTPMPTETTTTTPDAARHTGTIRELLAGFGFITPDAARDCFFHKKDLAPGLHFGQLTIGARVEFGIRTDDVRGPRAERVVILA